MADIVINSINIEDDQSQTTIVAVGEAASPGKVLRFSDDDNAYMIADSDVDADSAEGELILLTTVASAGDNGLCLIRGRVSFGSALSQGRVYVLSNNPGGICPISDLGAGDWLCIIGWAEDASVLRVEFKRTGVQLA